MDIATATTQARAGKLLPVYLVGGKERLLVSRCADAVRIGTVGSGPRGLSEDVFDGKKLSAQTVLTTCRTLPMMAKRRLVTVRAVNDMEAPEQEALISYFSNPEPSTVLLLVATELDQRRKLVASAKTNGFLFVAEPLKDHQLEAWLSHEATARNVTLLPGTAELLSVYIGPDLSLLGDAIERLSLYTNNQPISPEHVETMIVPVRELPAWDLGDAIATRDASKCLSVLGRLLSQGQHPLPILFFINRQVTQLARARQWLASDRQTPLASELKLKPDVARAIASHASRWSPALLHRALRVIAATDSALKGSRRGDDRIIEECVLALCGAPGMNEPALHH